MLEKKEIPLQNIVGMASDNASVMIGCNNSFMSFKIRNSGFCCICHLSALIANRTCEKVR